MTFAPEIDIRPQKTAQGESLIVQIPSIFVPGGMQLPRISCARYRLSKSVTSGLTTYTFFNHAVNVVPLANTVHGEGHVTFKMLCNISCA